MITTMSTILTAMPAAHFHDDSEAVRFWVTCDDGSVVGASIGKMTLHYSFRGEPTAAGALAAYLANREVIDATVRRRVAAGSIEPVMLRERDLPTPARR
jgi:hypothetical protein